MHRCVTLVLSVSLLLSAILMLVEGPATAQPKPDERPQRKVAFLVGPEKYLHDFGALSYTAEDVRALAEFLRDKAGFDEVVVLTDPPEGKNPATRANILDKLDKLLNKNANEAHNIRKDDIVLVALSGHGLELDVPDPTQPGKKRRETFFAPCDGKKGKADTLVSLNQLVDDYLAPCGGRNLLLVDACREVYDPNKGKGIGGKNISLAGQTSMLLSCSSTEKSWESTELKHGVFTNAVLEVLGEGVADGKALTWTGLVAGVEDKMSSDDYRKRIPEGTQTPVLRASEVPATALLTVRKRAEPDLLKAPFTAAQAKAAQEAWAKYLKRKVVEEVSLGDGVAMEFVLIPPGIYKRGTSEKDVERLLKLVKDSKREEFEDETPQQTVTITRPFYLGKSPVTQEQYRVLTNENPSWFSATGQGKDKVKDLDTARFPVENVSWDDAVKYNLVLAKKATRKARLPREAEWEYACRAGTETFYHFGDVLNGDRAACDGNYPFGTEEKGPYLKRTCRVGAYATNAFGLQDMHGNVWQWCEDYYGLYKGLVTTNPWREDKYDNKNLRVLRGGSWNYYAKNCRSAFRIGSAPAYSAYSLGFRVCLPLD